MILWLVMCLCSGNGRRAGIWSGRRIRDLGDFPHKLAVDRGYPLTISGAMHSMVPAARELVRAVKG